MRQNSGPRQQSAEKHVKEIRRRTRRKFSAEEKIRIVLAGLRGEASIFSLVARRRVVSGREHSLANGLFPAKSRRSGTSRPKAVVSRIRLRTVPWRLLLRRASSAASGRRR